MGLVFKHEALLTFVGRLVRDREYSEWFVTFPSQALASHGLTRRDVRDMADVLADHRQQLQTAQAVSPIVDLFLEILESEGSVATHREIVDRLDRLEVELRMTHDRLARVSLESRAWWTFWKR